MSSVSNAFKDIVFPETISRYPCQACSSIHSTLDKLANHYQKVHHIHMRALWKCSTPQCHFLEVDKCLLRFHLKYHCLETNRHSDHHHCPGCDLSINSATLLTYLTDHDGLIDALNNTFDTPIPTHELQVIRDAIGQMGWDNNAIAQYLRTKRYWRSRLYIDQAVEHLHVSQARGVTFPISYNITANHGNSSENRSMAKTCPHYSAVYCNWNTECVSSQLSTISRHKPELARASRNTTFKDLLQGSYVVGEMAAIMFLV